MPEHTPDGPVPAHLPAPFDFVNCPVPCASRGPATALIFVCREPKMMPYLLTEPTRGETGLSVLEHDGHAYVEPSLGLACQLGHAWPYDGNWG